MDGGSRLFLDGHARFEEPLAMQAAQTQRLPGRAAWVRERPLCAELVLVTGG